ncbi:unnamed protein product [Ectocarpus sp. 6 AP-2014]
MPPSASSLGGAPLFVRVGVRFHALPPVPVFLLLFRDFRVLGLLRGVSCVVGLGGFLLLFFSLLSDGASVVAETLGQRAPLFLPKMGRMHSGGKGISKSSLPYRRSAPSWLKVSAQEVTEHVCKLAKKGLTPSQIGVILRDSNGIAQVSAITGAKILRVLKANGLAAEIPEDLYMLIKKAVAVRKHLERNRRDKDSKFRLILIESRIHRLARYYRTNRKLAANWKYQSASASALVA